MGGRGEDPATVTETETSDEGTANDTAMSSTVGLSNGLRMRRNLTGGLSVLYQGHSANTDPFQEGLTPAHEKRQKGAPEDIGVSNCKTDNGENARMHETNTYAK